MPGFSKDHRRRQHGHTFPASRYDDPRGARASALERNILRYRSVEATLYLFYAEQVRDFMMTNVYPRTKVAPGAPFWEPTEERRISALASHVLMDAEGRGIISADDSDIIRQTLASEHNQGRQLKAAFGHAIQIGMFTAAEADELQVLMTYRNDIAHRIHGVMSDVTRTTWNADYLSFKAPLYKGEALDRLRAFGKGLWQRSRGKLITQLSMKGVTFEMAEQVFGDELKRLDTKIRKLVAAETARVAALRAELDLSGTELVGDLAPGFYYNQRPSRTFRDDYIPPTGHLTKRGAEICYRLFDLNKSPMAVAYLMGITLRSAERRRRSWVKTGGHDRVRVEVERYDLDRGRRQREA
jgi:hypothetical protein